MILVYFVSQYSGAIFSILLKKMLGVCREMGLCLCYDSGGSHH